MRFDEAHSMNTETDVNKLGLIRSGKYKNNFCIVLKESSYIKNEKIKFYTVYKDNIIFKINSVSVKIL